MNISKAFYLYTLFSCLTSPSLLQASIAYGSLNNFDVVNDTTHPCHGFEIELEDTESVNISYTFDYNHYGTPSITQDNSISGHPKCIIRWASKKNADGSWAAYTAVPTAPIAATDGHAFTDPTVNFGGEHFGVGYLTNPSAVHYRWLIDDGAGNLINGGNVLVATPVFNYSPPVAAAPAVMQAVIQPAPPPEPPTTEFGDAVWVKEIRTETHNANKIKLRDLLTDDPNDAEDKNWQNGEPDEVEVEWQLLQTDYNSGNGGANGELQAAPEELSNGDECITRRYEFYAYTGPLDEETGEAMCENIAEDNIHGVGIKEINGVEVDLSTIEVVGNFIGSQMSAANADEKLSLVDHVSEAEVDAEYAERRLVIAGASPFTATFTGVLPTGMSFNNVTGVLSGTPAQSGDFSFTLHVSDAQTPAVEKNYVLQVADAAVPLPPKYQIDTTSFPLNAGSTTGTDFYDPDSQVTLGAVANSGFIFDHWTDNGAIVSYDANYAFSINVSRTLVAHFLPILNIEKCGNLPQIKLSWTMDASDWKLEESTNLDMWAPSTRATTVEGALRSLCIPTNETKRFFRLSSP